MTNDRDELPPKGKSPGMAVGEDISAMSEHELVARVAALEAEIARCRTEIGHRQATRVQAHSVFRNP